MDELKDLKKYWAKKYPNVYVAIYCDKDKCSYTGIMKSPSESISLSATTLGNIISQGESFLRRYNAGKT